MLHNIQDIRAIYYWWIQKCQWRLASKMAVYLCTFKIMTRYYTAVVLQLKMAADGAQLITHILARAVGLMYSATKRHQQHQRDEHVYFKYRQYFLSIC